MLEIAMKSKDYALIRDLGICEINMMLMLSICINYMLSVDDRVIIQLKYPSFKRVNYRYSQNIAILRVFIDTSQ